MKCAACEEELLWQTVVDNDYHECERYTDPRDFWEEDNIPSEYRTLYRPRGLRLDNYRARQRCHTCFYPR